MHQGSKSPCSKLEWETGTAEDDIAWPNPSISGVCMHVCIYISYHVVINPQCACAAKVTVIGTVCVCRSVCLSTKLHLTSGASVRPESNVSYSTGNEGQNICGDFSETALLLSYTAARIVWLSVQSAILLLENMHAHCISACFQHGESNRSNCWAHNIVFRAKRCSRGEMLINRHTDNRNSHCICAPRVNEATQ